MTVNDGFCCALPPAWLCCLSHKKYVRAGKDLDIISRHIENLLFFPSLQSVNNETMASITVNTMRRTGSRVRQCYDVVRTLPAATQQFQSQGAHLVHRSPQYYDYSSVRQIHLPVRPTLLETSDGRFSSKNSAPPYRSMTTAYSGIPSDGKHNSHLLTDVIPYQSILKDGRRVEVDFFRHSPTDSEDDEWYAGMALMNLIIREGRSWPFDEDFASVEDWRGYFLSHTAFVVRALDNGMDAAKRNSSSQGEILGCFYIKPNFPGRCSHICNGGFITAPRFRGLGIGRLMGNVFLRAARDLGYKSSYFNLVFKSNLGSVKLWESLGFERVATLEKAAALEGLEEGELDTAYGYRYDLEKLPGDHLGIEKKS